MPTFSLPLRPPDFTVQLLPTTERSPTTSFEIHSFGDVLEPRYIFRAKSLDQ